MIRVHVLRIKHVFMFHTVAETEGKQSSFCIYNNYAYSTPTYEKY